MPAGKKVKMQKLIKSINKKTNVLSLSCEWDSCIHIGDHVGTFIEHVQQHLDEYMMSAESASVDMLEGCFKCCWRDCSHDDIFTSVTDLRRHVFFHVFHCKLKSIGATLSEQNNLAPCLLDIASRNTLPELPDHLVCSWHRCQQMFDISEYYFDHVAEHADFYPKGNNPDGGCVCMWEGCSTVVKSKHKLKEHLRTHTQEKTMACPTCGSLFANATKLFDHIQRQADANTHHYECSHCNKRCATERLLRDHMRQHVNHYRCPFCEKTCPNPSSLRTHVHYRHTEDRPYKCQSCEYSAKAAVDLRRHSETHNQSWISCDIDTCSFRARYFWEMNLHCRNAHEGVEAAKYMCHVCGHKYRRGNRLTAHLRLKHHFKWPSGHTRFRYKQHEDGYYRLLTITYESVDMKEQVIGTAVDPQVIGSVTGHSQGAGSFIEPSLDAQFSMLYDGTQQKQLIVTDDAYNEVTDNGVVYLSNLELLGNVAVSMPRPDADSSAEPSTHSYSPGTVFDLYQSGLTSTETDLVSTGYVTDVGADTDNKLVSDASASESSMSWKGTDMNTATSPTCYLTLSGHNDMGEGSQQPDPDTNVDGDGSKFSITVENNVLKVYQQCVWPSSVSDCTSSSLGTTVTANLPSRSFSLTLSLDSAETDLMFDPTVGTFVVDSNANFNHGKNVQHQDQHLAYVADGQLTI